MRVPDHPPERASSSGTCSHPANAPVTALDVRDDLRNRREPFSRIMAAIEALPDDGVLRLRATFEPTPLITLLGRRGFLFESAEVGPGDWWVWFWREGMAGLGARHSALGEEPGALAPRVERDEAAVEEAPGDVLLDVRGLEPPEPMVRTLAALEALPPGRTLIQVNVRAPQFLLPILAERGFVWEIDESESGRVLVRIRHRG